MKILLFVPMLMVKAIRLKDIGRAELGSEFFDIYSNLDGHPSASIVLKQNYGSNASDVIERVKEKLEEMKESFPPGLDYKISYDVSKFLDASIEQVIDTLRDAFILVAIVVFIFLGDWRSTLIPILAVPVSLIGAFFVIQFFGISINLVTLVCAWYWLLVLWWMMLSSSSRRCTPSLRNSRILRLIRLLKKY